MSPLRTVILCGSPHPAGGSMTLARAVTAAVGGRETVFLLYDMDIRPCRDCGVCAGGGSCPLEDDVPAVLEALAGADAAAAASPLHFTSLTAPLVALFSRLQPLWVRQGGRRPVLPGSPEAALAVTAGGNYPNMFSPARSVAAAAFTTLGMHFAGMAAAADTDRTPVPDNTAALAQAEELGREMRTALLLRSGTLKAKGDG